MTIVTGVFIPGANDKGYPISNSVTPVLALSLDIWANSNNNSNTAPTFGGNANGCYGPLSWSKSALLPSVDMTKVFIQTGNNTDGVTYAYVTLP